MRSHRKHFVIIAIISSIALGDLSAKQKFPILKGPYLGQTPPGKTAVQFAPGILSTDLHDDASPAFSLDLRSVFVRIVYKIDEIMLSSIFYSREGNDGWTIPRIDTLSANLFNGAVHISRDDKRRYMTVDNGSNGTRNMDIAVSYKTDEGWGPLEELSELNSQYNEGAVFEEEGYLYWNIEAKRNDPDPKVYRSKIGVNKFSPKEQVSGFPSGALLGFINTDNGYAIMTMRTRDKQYDLFICFINGEGEWGKPINMGPSVNSAATEKAASISPDGKYIFFVSSRPENLNPKRLWEHPDFKTEQNLWKADIYWVDSSIIEDLRPEK